MPSPYDLTATTDTLTSAGYAVWRNAIPSNADIPLSIPTDHPLLQHFRQQSPTELRQFSEAERTIIQNTLRTATPPSSGKPIFLATMGTYGSGFAQTISQLATAASNDLTKAITLLPHISPHTLQSHPTSPTLFTNTVILDASNMASQHPHYQTIIDTFTPTYGRPFAEALAQAALAPKARAMNEAALSQAIEQRLPIAWVTTLAGLALPKDTPSSGHSTGNLVQAITQHYTPHILHTQSEKAHTHALIPSPNAFQLISPSAITHTAEITQQLQQTLAALNVPVTTINTTPSPILSGSKQENAASSLNSPLGTLS